MTAVVDLCAGAGGWDVALADLDVTDVVGLEIDHDACVTAAQAGHARVRCDITTYPTAAFFGVDGIVASPPCQAFSTAGHGKGRAAVDGLLEAVHACRDGWVDPPEAICSDDVRADLTLQPLRWTDACRPRWMAVEQVPPALPLLVATAEVLQQWGWWADARVVNAADYGVPQTRRRAILLASQDGPVAWPAPTHHDPRKGQTLFGASWVSMADMLGWDGRLDRRQTQRGPAGREPVVQVETGRPAPTLTVEGGAQWVAVMDGNRRHAVTHSELGVLQSFPADYPWSGNKTSRYRQVGNAIPPGLCRPLLAQFVRPKDAT